jgi:threonine aldolase
MIDLRSDTVTQPTDEMRRAMAEAEVGDDVFGDDPTVNELERVTAELLGKEAAVFVPSGTMANQLALRVHTRHGDEILLEGGAHILNYEAGAAAALAGVMCRTIEGRRGVFTADDLLNVLRRPDVHNAPQRLVCVENTHNVGGGSIWPLGTLAELSAAGHDRGLALHMDGARLWNATAATGTPERGYAAHCDTVSVCYSKGLGAPVGSALVGSAKLIGVARRFRKMYGGGMRQAGILAAGALHALQHHRQRLIDDHANARALAEGLIQIPGVMLDGGPVETNIVRFRIPGEDAQRIATALRDRGVLLLPIGPESFRAVTHLMITRENIDAALAALREIIEAARDPLRPSRQAHGGPVPA